MIEKFVSLADKYTHNGDCNTLQTMLTEFRNLEHNEMTEEQTSKVEGLIYTLPNFPNFSEGQKCYFQMMDTVMGAVLEGSFDIPAAVLALGAAVALIKQFPEEMGEDRVTEYKIASSILTMLINLAVEFPVDTAN